MSAGSKAIILIILLAGCVYLFGNARVQLWDRDEPRYAECSRQMLQGGDWVVPRLYDKLRFQKPPLIYWCQASAMKLLGSQGDAGAMSARLPSAIFMLATLAMLAILIARQAGIEQAKWTVFVFATSAMTIVAAKSCLTDGVLIFFVTGAQLCFFAIWRGSRSWTVAILLAVALGLGILTKGPFILGILATTGAALGAFHLVGKVLATRRAGRRGFAVVTGDPNDMGAALPLPVGVQPAAFNAFRLVAQIFAMVVILAAIVVPWIILVHHRAPDFLPAMLHEGKMHTLEGKEGHHFPPGYHFVVVWAMFMPWSLLLPLAIGMGIRHRQVPEVRFALAAILGPWLMVEFMGTKLPHYFLPAYPAMAYLVAFAIRQALAGDSRGLESRAFLAGAAIWALAIVGVGAVPWVAGHWFRPLPWDSMVGLTFFTLLVAGCTFALLKSRRFKAAFFSMGVGMAGTIGFASRIFADAPYLRISTHIANTLIHVGAVHPGDVKMVDYKEPSLAFYQGGTIREVEKKSELIYKPVNEWPHWVVITREAWDMVPAATQSKLKVIDSCRGWAYADRGRVLEVMVVEKSGD
jgi:4-amino-4-deoxy-L-arabinose transferase-like glycosyltransferase